MRRLVRRADVTGYTYPIDRIRHFLERTPSGVSLFGLDADDQRELERVLDTFTAAVMDAAARAGLGVPRLEVGVVPNGTLAYYAPGANTIVINLDDESLPTLLNAGDDFIRYLGMHEYGHYVDERLGDVSRTSGWMDVLERSTVDWLDGYAVNDDTDVSSEAFANAFVAWAWGVQPDDPVTAFVVTVLERGGETFGSSRPI